jgi:signal transduction histidine kinase
MRLTLPALAVRNTSTQARHSAGWRIRAGLGWLALAALGAALTTLTLAFVLRPSPAATEQIALYLGLSGAGSVALGQLALGLASLARVGLWFRLALPAILSALVIAFNTLIAEWLMLVMGEGEQVALGALFLVYGVALALLLALAIAREMTRAITQIETSARRIAEGDYGYRLAEDRDAGEELARLAGWFNQMAASVERSFDERAASEAARRQLVAAVSHDLRTPLASVRAMIEAIDDGVVTDEATVRRYQRAIRAETRRLGALLNELFELSRLESGGFTLNRERLALDDLLSDALESARERAERRGVTLAGRIDAALPLVTVDARQLRRALDNLLGNALRHTSAGGAILLYAVSAPDTRGAPAIRIAVADSGVGIADTDLPYIFERAYRGDSARARGTLARSAPAVGDAETCEADEDMPGAGLGLTIARGIIVAHGGSMTALSPLPNDLRALLDLHRASASVYRGAALLFTLPALDR